MAGQSRAETRRMQILGAAERVFSRKGLQAATISEVAKEAGVSDATIYEYFSSKDELLFSITEETTRIGNESLEKTLDYIRGAANKIRSIIYHYLSYYQQHPDYSAVAMLILKTNRKFVGTKAYETVREGYRIIIRVLEEGMEAGEFKKDIDPYLVRSVILGAIEHMVIRWQLLGRPENLVEAVDPLTDMIISGIRKQDRPKTWNLRVTLDSADESGDRGAE